jgi:hypothetical protein
MRPARRGNKPGGGGGYIKPSKKNAVSQVAVTSTRMAGGKMSCDGQSFQECERIGEVPGSVAFAVVGEYPVNAALPGTFPWLSQIAKLYEFYSVEALTFTYQNVKGTDSPGNVIMAFDFDTTDPAPLTASKMCMYTQWVATAPWQSRSLTINLRDVKKRLFTREGIISKQDMKLYDAGKLVVAAEGCADTTLHGYIEVSYKIRLYAKQFSESVDNQTTSAMYEGENGQAFATGVEEVVAFPTTMHDNIDFGDATAGVFTPVKGTYYLDFSGSFNNSSAESTSWTLKVYKNAVAESNEAFHRLTTAVNTAVRLPLSHIVSVNGTDTISFKLTATGAAGTLTTYQKVYLLVTQV